MSRIGRNSSMINTPLLPLKPGSLVTVCCIQELVSYVSQGLSITLGLTDPLLRLFLESTLSINLT